MAASARGASRRLCCRVLVVVTAAATAPLTAMAVDTIRRPPAFEAVPSPAGSYQVEISLPAPAGPHAAASVLTLVRFEAGQRLVLWQQRLPHRPRPRYALVSDAGQVLLLDEWIHVSSEHALTLIGRDGKLIARHALPAVREALGLDAAALASRAQHGPWLQAPPRIASDGLACEAQAGDRTLLISLRDGRLSSR